jgi:chemotaxis protein MotC
MNLRRLACGFLGLACLSASARAGEPTLSEMVDNLQRLQVRIASGDKAAFAAEPAQLRAIGSAVGAAKPELWKDHNETIAAIVYLLSGGQPREIARALQTGGIPKGQDKLMRGALAYVLGHESEAQTLIGAVDPRALDLRIAGHFAYVLAVTEKQRNPTKAMALFDLARLLAPGGLVEEASLRREILLAGELKAADRVATLARQYLVRFGGSIYAVNFMQGFATTVVRLNLIETLASLQQFQRSARSMTPENRRGFMLAIARGELENGRFDVAEAAAQSGLRDASGNSADELRGQLYQGAGEVLGDKFEQGTAQLEKLASSNLNAGDRALLAAVREIAAHLHEAPRLPADGGHRKSARAPVASDAADSAAATIALAEAASTRTARLTDLRASQ